MILNEQCAFATRLHAYDDHQQQAVSKFKLREKERQHSHGNFGRMLGGFYNFFFKASRPDVRYTMYALQAALQCFSCATLKHHHPLRLDRPQWGYFLSEGGLTYFDFSYTCVSTAHQNQDKIPRSFFREITTNFLFTAVVERGDGQRYKESMHQV